jgi:hypothetical protein
MKKLSCYLGHHRWTSTVEHGETLTSCSVCGAEHRGGSSSAARDDLLSAKATGESQSSMSRKY